jgi:hypothetical protein
VRSAGLVTAGVLIAAAGSIWALQGYGVIGGSFMSGSTIWAVIGPVVAAAGIVLIVLGLRSRDPAR